MTKLTLESKDINQMTKYASLLKRKHISFFLMINGCQAVNNEDPERPIYYNLYPETVVDP